MNTNTIMAALEIMGKGMAGIFAAILIIILCVWILGKIGK
jgi:Na+-transporting methylmalonyl-CoA/oxaloacetate decarboxylase gamma subunit